MKLPGQNGLYVRSIRKAHILTGGHEINTFSYIQSPQANFSPAGQQQLPMFIILPVYSAGMYAIQNMLKGIPVRRYTPYYAKLIGGNRVRLRRANQAISMVLMSVIYAVPMRLLWDMRRLCWRLLGTSLYCNQCEILCICFCRPREWKR